jgi:hypothetical protein
VGVVVAVGRGVGVSVGVTVGRGVGVGEGVNVGRREGCGCGARVGVVSNGVDGSCGVNGATLEPSPSPSNTLSTTNRQRV